MRKPQIHQVALLHTYAARAVATRTNADTAMLAKYVAKVFDVTYAKAATIVARKYRLQVADVSDAGKGMYCVKDGIPVGYDKEVVLEVRNLEREAGVADAIAMIGI